MPISFELRRNNQENIIYCIYRYRYVIEALSKTLKFYKICSNIGLKKAVKMFLVTTELRMKMPMTDEIETVHSKNTFKHIYTL